jgi:glycosyltransferase involved in cell wall biosynthesis
MAPARPTNIAGSRIVVSRKFFIVVPSLNPTGPVKGAFALANALVPMRNVTLIHLKDGVGAAAPLDTRVNVLSLAEVRGGWRKKIEAYRSALNRAGSPENVASISMCLSADFVNIACRAHAATCSSVRGNLIANYNMDYGLPGIPLAVMHLAALRWCDHVVAMTRAMADQVALYCGSRPAVIPNFVDEASLERYRSPGPKNRAPRFVYVASLSRRKRPHVLLTAFAQLRRRGMDAHLDIIGAGPLHMSTLKTSSELGVAEWVTFHGHLSEPYDFVAQADVMVLPSLSEGTPRAALEALFLGVPCVLRDVDGNAELIQPGINGFLFRTNRDLAEAMERAIELSQRLRDRRDCLLPETSRQTFAALSYLELLENST